MKNRSELLAIAQGAIDIGRKLMADTGPGQVHTKGDRDLVTDLDLRIQNEIRVHLENITPDFDFLGEEYGGGAVDPSVEYV